jgi:hypothetical protein
MKNACPLFLLLWITLIAANAGAQQQSNSPLPKNEFTLSYGVVTIPEIAVSIGNLFATSITGQELDDIRGGGALILSYNHYAREKFSWGFTGIYEKVTTTYKNPADEYDWTALTFMANGKYYYISNSSVRLYSGIALGYSNLNSKSSLTNDNNGVFAFQLNALGIRFGNRVGVLSELGFGYEGVVKAGISFRF